MRRLTHTIAVFFPLLVASWAFGGDPYTLRAHQAFQQHSAPVQAGKPELLEEQGFGEPGYAGCWRQFGPVGGWNPYGGGLLHWWPQHCFPRDCGPNDCCRKPLPRVCWPPYPPYYIWGPPEVCHRHGNCGPACGEAH
jgi:hypothetical protein